MQAAADVGSTGHATDDETSFRFLRAFRSTMSASSSAIDAPRSLKFPA
jgi:hypothetical protein